LATNSYIDNVSWYGNNPNYFSFHTITSWTTKLTGTSGNFCIALSTINVQHGGYQYNNPWFIPLSYVGADCSANQFTFVAGQTYILNTGFGYTFNASDYTINISGRGVNEGWVFEDFEHYYFTEVPTLTITYPEDNAEIVGKFDIQGSYTTPNTSTDYMAIEAVFDRLLTASSSQLIGSYSFYQYIYPFATSTVSIAVGQWSGLPAGYYFVHFNTIDASGYDNYDFSAPLLDLTIVDDIYPYTPPVMPIITSSSIEELIGPYTSATATEALIEQLGLTGIWADIADFGIKLVKAVFIPSVEVINAIEADFSNLVTNKIPFSYFYDIYSSFSSSTVGVATSTPQISYTIGGVAFAYSIFDIPSQITETAGWQNFYLFLRYGCYLMFVYYIIARVRGVTEKI
jgi:hypothetical protein